MPKLRAHVLVVTSLCLAACANRPAPGSIGADVLDDALSCEKQYASVSTKRRDLAIAPLFPVGLEVHPLTTLPLQYVRAELSESRRANLLNPTSGHPKQCIALSGGGQRAAAYAIGVLRAMQSAEETSLRNTAYISAVSGGGYALGWLMANAKDGEMEHVFAPDGPAQLRLRETASDGASAVSNLIIGFLVFLGMRAPAIYDKTAGENTIRINWSGYGNIDYGSALRGQFLSDPERPWSAWDRSPGLSQLWEKYRSSELPYPIWNSTALPLEWVERQQVDGATQHVERPARTSGMCPALRQAAFEISLDKMGNSVYGYMRNDFKFGFMGDDLDVSFPMTVSGAAFESPQYNQLILGAKITSFIADAQASMPTSSGPEHSAIPEALWLTDGGRLDNLGVLPLVLRGCEHITVVDAEHDPTLAFNAFQNLRQNLQEAWGLELTVNALEKQIETANSCKGSKDKFRQTRWMWEQPVLPVSRECFQGDRIDQPYPVYSGSIRVTDGSLKDQIVSRVTYVKLGINAQKLLSGADYSDAVRNIYQRDLDLRDKKGKPEDACTGTGMDYRCRFPHQATVNQALPAEDWNAYVELGYLNYSLGMGLPK